VNRSALAARVFGDSTEAIAARRTLESIVHPAIRAAREVEIERLRQSGDASTLLVDAALLLEADWAGECDQIVYIDTPEPLRRQRVAERGWSAAEFARREASQWPLDRKKAAADHVIPNDRTLDIAGRELYEYIQQTLHPRT
jgi:dephospho-CoA kinase